MCLCGIEEWCVSLKTGSLSKFGESPNYSGWDPDFVRVGASTLTLSSLRVYSFSESEIYFYVIICFGARFLSKFSAIMVLHVTDACGTSQNLTVC